MEISLLELLNKYFKRAMDARLFYCIYSTVNTYMLTNINSNNNSYKHPSSY